MTDGVKQVSPGGTGSRRVTLHRRLERASRLWSATRSWVASWIERHLPNEAQHLFALTLLTGVVCGLAAVAFHLAIRAVESLLIDRALHASGSSWMVWTVVSPTVGGLCAGALLTWVVPGARGSGIPQVKQAFAVEGGRVKVRDAVGKFFVGALNIGSGGSLGREGPTVQICAGVASLLGRLTLLRPRNMRRLTPVGVAAGIAAAFNAPIAAVTFTIEEVVGTLDQAVLSGVVIAAAVAAVIERGILGVHPVFEIERSYALDHPSSLAWYALLGVAAAFVSVAFSDALLGVRMWFRRLKRVPAWMHPGIGGCVTGIIAVGALYFLQVGGITGGGYEALGQALGGHLALRALLALCVLKVVATVFSYSSGGAGGIFAPTLFVGAMLGGVVGYLDILVFGHETTQLGAFALVGMGAVFAGVIRAPITSVLIIFEMTGGYGLVLPLMLSNMVAYGIARKMRPVPIYEALLAQDGVVLPHAQPTRVPHPLEQLTVADAMTADVLSARDGQSVLQAATALTGQTFTLVPVLDAREHLLGVLPLAKLFDPALAGDTTLTSLMRNAPVVRSTTPLLQAVVQMSELGTRQLFAVAPGSEKLVGVLTMTDVVRAHAKAAASSPTLAAPAAQADIRAEHLMVAAAVIAPATRIAELRDQLRAGAKALIVRKSDDVLGVVLTADVDEVMRDESLQKLMVADDLAVVVPWVRTTTELQEVARSLADSATDAIAVVDARTDEPVGIVTKAAVASALFDQYVAQTRRMSATPTVAAPVR